MHISFKRISFAISFGKKIRFNIPIPFIFRSIIGYQLRKMCCIASNNVCTNCMFNATCIFGFTFESIVPKNNPALAGRDRVSHPIIIDSDDFEGIELDSIILNLIFLGTAIPYIPYFYYALKKGGEAGLFKERIPYEVCDIIEFHGTEKEHSLKINEQLIDTQLKPEQWEYNIEKETELQNNFLITLVSPLRYKAQGHYARKIIEDEFVYCLHRRTQILCTQYGINDYSNVYKFTGNWTIMEQNTQWKDHLHYSARQKKEMLLGGLVGNFVLSGKFSFYEYSLLQFAELFHCGKNTNFGLGKIKVSEYDKL